MHNSALFPILLSASTFLSYSALAACTANPDCATLGYDKTSCPSGDSVLKCPFDTTKLKCIPQTCETIGKRTCGENCVPTTYEGCCVGDIYYSDKTCSSDLISGKTPIGVVGYVSNGGKNGIVVEKNHSSSKMYWGCYEINLSCITNMPGSNGDSNPELRADYNGTANTACIVQNNCSYNGATGAGVYCNSRNVEGVTGWYLPAGGELYETMVANRSSVNTGLSKIFGFTAIPSVGTSIYYWSSSEYDNFHGWGWTFNNDYWGIGNKSTNMYYNDSKYVRCVLAF